MKCSLNSKDSSDHEINRDPFCIKNMLQSAGGALEKGQESHLSSKVEFESSLWWLSTFEKRVALLFSQEEHSLERYM